MDISSILFFITGSGIGFLIGLTGVGGGVLLMPILILGFGMEVSLSVGTASAFMILTKIYAGFEHARIKNIDYNSSKYFLIGSIPGVLISAGLINYIISSTSIDMAYMQKTLNYIIAGAMFLSVWAMVMNTRGVFEVFKKKYENTTHFKMLIFMGFLIGLLMGATGIGGGALLIPIFFLLTNLDAKKIVGTSILIALITSTITAIFYAKGGHIDYYMAGIMTIGSILGVFLASRVIKLISIDRLQNIIILLIIVSGFLLLMSA